MRIRFVSRALAVLGFCAVAGAADAQSGTVTGTVTRADGGTAVADADVFVLSGRDTVGRGRTGADGSYRIGNVPAGLYAVAVRIIGSLPERIEGVRVTEGSTATANITIAARATMLGEVAVTGVRGAGGEKILDSPSPIFIVSKDRIEERPSITVTDHLKSTPGLSISNGGLVQANIVSRGFNNAFSTTMMMLQDYRFAGVPSLRVNVPFLFTGTIDDVERIEVMQGPASALYGPNSGAGVLHVITKSPFDSRGTLLTLDGGTQSMMRLGARHAGTISSRFGYKVSGEYFTATDFEYNDPNETAASTTYSATDPRIPASRQGQPIQRNFDLERYSGEARFDYRPSGDTEFITTLGHSVIGNAIEITTTFGAAQAINWSYTNLQQRFRHKRTFAQLFYNASDAGNSSPDDDAGTYYLRSGIPVVDQSTVLVGQVQQGFDLAEMGMVAGLDYIATTPKTAGTIMGRNEDDDNITEVGAYLQFTRKLADKVDFVGAFRGDMNSRIEGTQFSPRAAILYKASESNTFRLTFNRAFNSPASFSFFLDQYSGQTPAPGMPVQIMGNRPKEGWQFSRTCNVAINGGLCMRSPYGAGEMTSAAANVWPAFATALPAIVAGLPVSAFGAGGETARGQLLGLLGGPVGSILPTLAPTPAQTPSVMVNLSTMQPVLNPASVVDLAPLGANFSNTWEIGYKGQVNEKLSVSFDYWYQIRPAEPTTQLINPGVLYVGAALGPYLQAQISAALQAPPYNVPPATANAQAAAASAALTPLIAALPQGAIALTDQNYNAPYLVFTYRNAVGQVDVRGVDLAIQWLPTEQWGVEATYSHLNRNVFPTAPGASAALPLAANAAKHRGSLTIRWANAAGTLNTELRGRYMDAFPVNSGVLNSYNAGTPVPYDPVPVNAFVDAGFSWRLPFAQNVRWAINAQNLLDSQVPSFVGVAPVGRFISTRVQYGF